MDIALWIFGLVVTTVSGIAIFPVMAMLIASQIMGGLFEKFFKIKEDSDKGTVALLLFLIAVTVGGIIGLVKFYPF